MNTYVIGCLFAMACAVQVVRPKESIHYHTLTACHIDVSVAHAAAAGALVRSCEEVGSGPSLDF